MGRVVPGPDDRVVHLPDGRRLGFATYGDAAGAPVISCHGGLVSRSDSAVADDTARALGLRIISPDRPGVGLTDRMPGHDIVTWADSDLRALVDLLEVDRFSVMGWSAGGQHALAVAHVLADRVDRVAVVAGCLPVDGPEARAQLSRLDQRLLRWVDHAVPVAKAYVRTVHQLARHAPGRLVAASAKGLEGDETGALDRNAAWFARTMAEASADPAGQVDDYRAYGSPWGFRPEDIEVPVAIHHGTADQLVPIAWAHELGRRIPRAEVHTYDGVGHLILATRTEPILTSLAAATW